jgi:hypothetical protein
MLSILVPATSIGAPFVHPTPTPAADLPVTVYQQRRARVLTELGDCAAVISSQGEVNGITEDYRQDADFYWLTGINEPGASLVLQRILKAARRAKPVALLRVDGLSRAPRAL